MSDNISDILLCEIVKFLHHRKTDREIAEQEEKETRFSTLIETIRSYRQRTADTISDLTSQYHYKYIHYYPDINKPEKVQIKLKNKDVIHINLINYNAYIEAAPNIWLTLEKQLIQNELT